MNISRLMLCLFITVVVVPVPSSWGFAKKAHEEMSKVAVKLYGELYPEKALQIKDLTALFIEGSAKEDNKTPQRGINWHFYDPGSRLGRAWWGAYKSNLHRFESLAEELNETKKENQRVVYELSGRLAHHIQDMRSPPHTIPIYHTTKDPFDKYATDKIPGYTLTLAQLNSVKKDPSDIDFATLNKLRKDAADDTIRRVGDTVIYQNKVIGENWSEYWRSFEQVGTECGEKPSKNFGCYGKNIFGETTGNFTPEVYDWFYEMQVTRAIQDSLRLLILLNK